MKATDTRKMRYIIALLAQAAMLTLLSCGGQNKGTAVGTDTIALKPCPRFDSDSAYSYIVGQCSYGSRVTGSDAAKKCGDWLVREFTRHGCAIEEQHGTMKAWDGKDIALRNITARYRPQSPTRVMLCSHWDSRPWADNDDDETKHHTPILGANDGASGVAVMLEIARLLNTSGDTLSFGIDFVCFDAEDMGTPQWGEDTAEDSETTWCLGSQWWSMHAEEMEHKPIYGILLDMVGGYGATFSLEKMSIRHAADVAERLWSTAKEAGYGHYFPMRDGGGVMDDHIFVNKAGIPCIDIIPYHEYGPSVFGYTWHTVQDTPENIDTKVLEAVGQSVIQMLFNENI